MFTRSLYNRACRAKQMPIISDKIPSPCRKLVSGDIMQPNPINFLSVETMKNVQRALLNCDHRGFPIVNQENYLIGFIPRNFILTLIEHHYFYKMKVSWDELMSSEIGIKQAQNQLKAAQAKNKNNYVKREDDFAVESITGDHFQKETD